MNSNTNQKINQVTEAYIVHMRCWQAKVYKQRHKTCVSKNILRLRNGNKETYNEKNK